MKNYLFTALILLIVPLVNHAQSVAINDDGSSPLSSAILDVNSTGKGLLMPRMKTSQRLAISSPANGLTVYDTDVKAFFYHDGTSWKALEKALPAGTILLSESSNDINLINAGYNFLNKATLNVDEAITITAQPNSWQPVLQGLSSRVSCKVVQAGNRIAIWGGIRDSYLNTGAFYNPSTDEWETISRTGAPSPRIGFAMVWTGTELVIWGGYTYETSYNYMGDGARYNPTTKTWTPLNTTGAPAARGTGTHGYNAATNEMVIWGGFNGPVLADGAKYNFTTNTWSAINNAGNPGTRLNYASAMAGDRLYIWGGYSYALAGQTNTGHYYSLTTNSWTAMSTAGANPSARESADAVWTGSELLVWGGSVGTTAIASGARYNPGTNSWTAITTGPAVDFGSSATFANNTMFVYGISGGAVYNNALNTWTLLPTFGGPEAGRNGVMVSSANGIHVIWGGKKYGALDDYLPFFDSGGRYFTTATPVTTNVRSFQSYYLYKKN